MSVTLSHLRLQEVEVFYHRRAHHVKLFRTNLSRFQRMYLISKT